MVRINIGGWKVVGCGSKVVHEFVQMLGPGQLVGLLPLGSVPLDPTPMHWERKGINGRFQSSFIIVVGLAAPSGAELAEI
jgi:hypothetical protein